jgi:hypothetical protein
MSPAPTPRAPRPHRRAPAHTVAAAVAAALVLASAGCGGGSDGMMTRQEFVDNLGARGDGLLNENIASCMYDGLSEDEEAADAVAEWDEGDAVPPELADLATECLKDPPDTPGP